MAQQTVSRALLSAALTSPLPTEFLLFTKGKNETSKGTFTFDAESAKTVLAAYKREGVDMMIDLNHDSLDPQATAARPDAGDARGWFTPQVRLDGSLWATNVKWTRDGAARLAEKTQRYVSPAFTHDESGRVTALVNVALVAMPATYDAQALVAASKQFGKYSSTTITARVTRAHAYLLRQRADRLKISPGELLRTLSSMGGGPASLAAVRQILGLPVGADLKAALAALEALFAAEPDAGAPAPKGAAPKSAPAAPATVDTATPAQLARAAAAGMTPAQFAVAKRDAVRRSPAKGK